LSKIIAISTLSGKYKLKKEKVKQFFNQHLSDPTAKRKLNYLFNHSDIEYKNSEIPDFDVELNTKLLYHDKYISPTTSERLKLYDELAIHMAIKVSKDAMNKANLKASDISHIITISCTGMSAPGLECQLIEQLQLNINTQKFTVNFMGCYAAFHGFRLADLIIKSNKEAKVLMVNVELCSLHFRDDNSDDNVLSSYLFSDGASACIFSHQITNSKHLEMLDYQSTLIPGGKHDMGWYIGNNGFEMVLNSEVPIHIKNNIKTSFNQLLKNNRIETIDFYAIHPGGPAIIQSFANALELKNEDLNISHQILKNEGNMSSATILFVLEKMMSEASHNGYCYSVAFGPGLSLEQCLFKLNA